jgi:hypothetical protein
MPLSANFQPSRETDDAPSLLTGRLAALRALLHEKFPAGAVRESGVLPTGCAALDEAEGGLRQGAVTELVGPSSAGALFLAVALRVLAREQAFGALVEAGNSFHPDAAGPSALARLLWVRCGEPRAALKAVDLLLHDGNLRLLVLDLQLTPERELRRIPASTWHRFQRVVETTGMAFVILTPQPMIAGAKTRMAVRQRWTLAAMRERRGALLESWEVQVFARRQFSALADGARQSA